MASGDQDHLTVRDFARVAGFIHSYSGIKMPEAKKTMVESRLRKRVAATGAADLADYCRLVFDRGGLAVESVHLIDAITTNKTEFFREPDHFRFLVDVALPELARRRRAGPGTIITAWSTASSIGAEPYTMAMVLADASARLGGFRIAILATDISTLVLATAVMGIYPAAMAAPVPPDMRRRYLLQSKDASRCRVRVSAELRRMVQFGRLNLMDAAYPVDRDMDLVFCRNMLIYFDKPTQHAILARLCSHLRPGGYLFLGHAESTAGCGLPLQQIGPSTFMRD